MTAFAAAVLLTPVIVVALFLAIKLAPPFWHSFRSDFWDCWGLLVSAGILAVLAVADAVQYRGGAL